MTYNEAVAFVRTCRGATDEQVTMFARELLDIVAMIRGRAVSDVIEELRVNVTEDTKLMARDYQTLNERYSPERFKKKEPNG